MLIRGADGVDDDHSLTDSIESCKGAGYSGDGKERTLLCGAGVDAQADVETSVSQSCVKLVAK